MIKVNAEDVFLLLIAMFLLYLFTCNCNCNKEGFESDVKDDPPVKKCSDLIDEGKGGCNFWGGCSNPDSECQYYPSYCGQNDANCKACGGTYCGKSSSPPSPPPSEKCSEPCKVKYTPCQPKFSQSVITNIKDQTKLVKVVYVSAWEIQGTFSEWEKHFDLLIQAGYNVIIISFIPQSDLKLNIPNWDILTCDEKAQLKNLLIKSNVVLLLSIGGGAAPHPSPFPGTNSNCMFNWIDLKDNSDNYVAKYAYDQLFDGIDFDLEWFSSGGSDSNTIKGCGDNLARQADIMRTYYKQQNIDPIITSAPQTPYFTEKSWAIDYVEMDKNHPDTFDWYNIQFYNNGNGNTYDSTIGYGAPNTIQYMINRGIPNNKIVLGKCGVGGNCCNEADYVGGVTLLRWAMQTSLKGIMYWSYLGACNPEATDWLKEQTSKVRQSDKKHVLSTTLH